ncbi:hypothetical protein Cpap_1505 [Ruminiclostridium papyrosolvens DSM 2782]|uniref:Uncharacterized protein n=1 Tax=Ruminiclostridium papyrosolvens DSM 2782 TaxID=588581 RepID=F1TEE7_9FIRM|nr:hypothetical protein [Ruminiclostridium papyrosolvens]EGD47113.1 hypothetical protein Cpap_1505 [Ruminiclostridium papyrosolvens DSM 2782]WES36056.1 hypothetical protein P0092_08860 [Ruminiclostridium papyrosolvens DSM 2782]WES36154.1 hypothetical protein P0092_09360 [Ruminiclostridium papyrosolvens DSM 2782]
MDNNYLKSERGIEIAKHFTNAELDTIRQALEHLADAHIKQANQIRYTSGSDINTEYEQKQRERAKLIRILTLDFLI